MFITIIRFIFSLIFFCHKQSYKLVKGLTILFDSWKCKKKIKLLRKGHHYEKFFLFRFLTRIHKFQGKSEVVISSSHIELNKGLHTQTSEYVISINYILSTQSLSFGTDIFSRRLYVMQMFFFSCNAYIFSFVTWSEIYFYFPSKYISTEKSLLIANNFFNSHTTY